ncbi:hypothetical protein PHYSODRAFT_259545 [Phytophthora sojae]|uniref:FAR1 domain-containing protein n=1 Tax=Phytophthora sojae (strain P6497) TaxID=1094619 RepID=G4Z1Z6_PHYSP|nr:hypothetical protein PHYSODRAFT_259545 [Phytophthora sojae]EGZ20687.1 hypothetical protein PHYSODRAFT_259545 [Phytophthora sojae]|eukprot:XP_009523404.1 hypothetical protein PHYSODRAFT_259545 [Phytophthora sojae]
MDSYARRSFQIFRKRTSTSVKLRNRRVAERLAKPAASADSARLIPENYVNYSVTLVCTHSGGYVSRGTGRRSRQDVRAMHCNVQVNACLKLVDPEANRYEVNVTRALLTHNHRVDKETYQQYSNARLGLSDELLSCVELMHKTGVKPKEIRSYIMENSNCTPTLKDVQNILQRLRNQERAAAAKASPDQLSASRGQTRLAVVPTTPEEEALREYRLATAAAANKDPPEPVEPTTQFKVAHAVGKAVATLLAEMPATEFAGAFRVMDVATNIVCERRAEAAAKFAAASEEVESETTTDADAALSVASAGVPSVDDPWARSL